MAHFPKILCPICNVLETAACDPDQGLPACDCVAEGYGPCKVYPCLRCCDKAIFDSQVETAPQEAIR